ncbi:MAG: GFA family protein [Pseudomonadota bacterium]
MTGTQGFPGGCLCGGVRYRIERRFLNAMHCHCDMCQRVHGGAFSTHLIVRPQQLVWERGEAELVEYASSASGRRLFCPICGAQMLIHGQSGDGTLAVPAGTLDGDPPLTILGHMFAAEALAWSVADPDLPRYPGWPPGFGGS